MKLQLGAACAALWWMVAPVLAQSGDDRVLAAREAAGKGDLTRLQALAAQTSNHPLEIYVQYWALSARIARLAEPVDADAVRGFLYQNAGGVLAERLRNEWVRRLGHDKRWDELNAEYALLTQPEQAQQCLAIQAGNSEGPTALLALNAQWLTLLDLPDTCESVLRERVAAGRFTADDVWQRFRRQIEMRRYTSARQTLSWLPGEAVPDMRDLQRLVDEPVRYLASPAARRVSTRMDRELLIAAVSRLARFDAKAAAARLEGLSSNLLSDADKAYLWGQIGWMGAQSREPEARQWFARAGGNGEMSEEQQAWRARASLRVQDWRGLQQAIEAMNPNLRDTPDWSYWLGRALLEQGRTQQAGLQFQRFADRPDFYGILATEALGREYRWPASPARTDEVARVAALAEVRRAEALFRLELRTEGLREWNWGLRGVDDRTLLAAAEYARRAGLYDRAIAAAERTRDEHDYALRYLAPHYEAFAREARARDLDLAWVYGLVRQESRFLPVARSGVGAQGLMQVMPATGQWIAKKQGWTNYEPGWLTRIDTNVQLGTAYLRYVLDQLDNHPVLASAAYNAGPSRARRWRDSRPLEGAIYIETIPFNETRDYVKKVMANAELYATLFERRPVALLARLGRIPAANAAVAGLDDGP
ncbi:MAG: transglycosylase [Candidatus Dactylopiibacterium carminicum]|nr:MAG: transglycosylase [Candidatus Dactylopiibacterium carminicum]